MTTTNDHKFTPSELALNRFLDRMTAIAEKMLQPIIGPAPLPLPIGHGDASDY